MHAIFQNETERDLFRDRLWHTEHRFIIGDILFTRKRRRPALTFHEIRLKESKIYCGNHPAGCEIIPGRKPSKRNFLEGADWVAWNDLLNDIADELRLDCDIASSTVDIRRGRNRRTNYDADWSSENTITGVFELWEKIGWDRDYIDNLGGQPMQSAYPAGTPGIEGYREA